MCIEHTTAEAEAAMHRLGSAPPNQGTGSISISSPLPSGGSPGRPQSAAPYAQHYTQGANGLSRSASLASAANGNGWRSPSDVFKALDLHNQGTISYKALLAGMIQLGHSSPQAIVKAISELLGTNDASSIQTHSFSLLEFLACHEQLLFSRPGSAATTVTSAPTRPGSAMPRSTSPSHAERRKAVHPGSEQERLLYIVYVNYCRYTVGQGKLLFDSLDPRMSSSQFVKLCCDMSFVIPNGPMDIVTIDLIFHSCKPPGKRRFRFPDFCKALDAIAKESQLHVMDFVRVIGKQIKPSDQFFAPKPVMICQPVPGNKVSQSPRDAWPRLSSAGTTRSEVSTAEDKDFTSDLAGIKKKGSALADKAGGLESLLLGMQEELYELQACTAEANAELKAALAVALKAVGFPSIEAAQRPLSAHSAEAHYDRMMSNDAALAKLHERVQVLEIGNKQDADRAALSVALRALGFPSIEAAQQPGAMPEAAAYQSRHVATESSFVGLAALADKVKDLEAKQATAHQEQQQQRQQQQQWQQQLAALEHCLAGQQHSAQQQEQQQKQEESNSGLAELEKRLSAQQQQLQQDSKRALEERLSALQQQLQQDSKRAQEEKLTAQQQHLRQDSKRALEERLSALQQQLQQDSQNALAALQERLTAQESRVREAAAAEEQQQQDSKRALAALEERISVHESRMREAAAAEEQAAACRPGLGAAAAVLETLGRGPCDARHRTGLELAGSALEALAESPDQAAHRRECAAAVQALRDAAIEPSSEQHRPGMRASAAVLVTVARNSAQPTPGHASDLAAAESALASMGVVLGNGAHRDGTSSAVTILQAMADDPINAAEAPGIRAAAALLSALSCQPGNPEHKAGLAAAAEALEALQAMPGQTSNERGLRAASHCIRTLSRKGCDTSPGSSSSNKDATSAASTGARVAADGQGGGGSPVVSQGEGASAAAPSQKSEKALDTVTGADPPGDHAGLVREGTTQAGNSTHSAPSPISVPALVNSSTAAPAARALPDAAATVTAGGSSTGEAVGEGHAVNAAGEGFLTGLAAAAAALGARNIVGHDEAHQPGMLAAGSTMRMLSEQSTPKGSNQQWARDAQRAFSSLQLESSSAQMPTMQEQLAGLQQQQEESQATLKRAIEALGLDPSGADASHELGPVVRSKEMEDMAADLQGRLGEAEAAYNALSEACPRKADLEELKQSVLDQLRTQAEAHSATHAQLQEEVLPTLDRLKDDCARMEQSHAAAQAQLQDRLDKEVQPCLDSLKDSCAHSAAGLKELEGSLSDRLGAQDKGLDQLKQTLNVIVADFNQAAHERGMHKGGSSIAEAVEVPQASNELEPFTLTALLKGFLTKDEFLDRFATKQDVQGVSKAAETNTDAGRKNMDALVAALKEVDTKYSKHSDCMAQVLIKTARQVDYLHNVIRDIPDSEPEPRTSIQVLSPERSTLTDLPSTPGQPKRPMSVAAMGDIGRSSVMDRLHDAQSKVGESAVDLALRHVEERMARQADEVYAQELEARNREKRASSGGSSGGVHGHGALGIPQGGPRPPMGVNPTSMRTSGRLLHERASPGRTGSGRSMGTALERALQGRSGVPSSSHSRDSSRAGISIRARSSGSGELPSATNLVQALPPALEPRPHTSGTELRTTRAPSLESALPQQEAAPMSVVVPTVVPMVGHMEAQAHDRPPEWRPWTAEQALHSSRLSLLDAVQRAERESEVGVGDARASGELGAGSARAAAHGPKARSLVSAVQRAERESEGGAGDVRGAGHVSKGRHTVPGGSAAAASVGAEPVLRHLPPGAIPPGSVPPKRRDTKKSL